MDAAKDAINKMGDEGVEKIVSVTREHVTDLLYQIVGEGRALRKNGRV